jgi:hypothetical protein
VVADAPSTVTRYTGSKAWIISEEISISMDTNPSAHTPAGTAKRPARFPVRACLFNPGIPSPYAIE